MQPTVLGLLVALLGLLAICRPSELTVRIALLLSLLGTGAAVLLPSIGGATILAGALFTGFAFLRMLLLPGGLGRMLYALAPPAPGFWLMIAVGYGVFAAFFIAPFFYGRLEVYPIARSALDGATFARSPLAFTSGNLTQSVYAIGQLLLFAAMAATVSSMAMRKTALNALVLLGGAHVLASALDVVTFYTGTAFAIDWLRVGGYTTWQNATVAGLKRISGLHPETSMYAIYGMTICGALLSLLVSGYRRRVTGPLFYVTLLMLLGSTSTTAYAALAVAGLLVGSISLVRAAQGRSQLMLILAKLAVTAVGAATVTVLVFPHLLDQVLAMVDSMVLSKMDSESGRDRSQLNAVAIGAFLDSGGLGLGLGGVRTSSFLATLLSNLGLVGTLAWGMFFLRTAISPPPLTRPGAPEPTAEAVILRRAAQSGMIGGFIGAAVSLHVFELGPLFYILAAFTLPVTRAAPAPAPQARPAPLPWRTPGHAARIR